MIQRAMKDSHISLHLNQNVKKQALEIITILKKTMRIEAYANAHPVHMCQAQ